MALKGYTTIELYDAKTGELTDRVEKHNLVTKGVQKYLNCVSNILVKNDSIGHAEIHAESGYNFGVYGKDEFLKLFGGVIVCNKNIDESKLYMDYDVLSSIVGHAGLSEARVYDSMSGGINMFESSYNTKTKTLRLVYDFATDKCNGDIACICLVNELLGGFGIMYNPTNKNGFERIDNFCRTFRGPYGYSIPIPLLDSDILGGAFVRYGFDTYRYKVMFKVWDFSAKDYLSSFGMMSISTIDFYGSHDVTLDFSSLKPDWINVVFWQYAVDSDSNCCYFYSLDPNTKIQRLRLIKLDKSYTDYSINLTNLYDEYKSLGGSDNINTISDFIARSVDYENNKFFLVASGIRKLFVGDLTSSSYQVFDLPHNDNCILSHQGGCLIFKLQGMYVLSYECSDSSSEYKRYFRVMSDKTYDVSDGFYRCMPNVDNNNLSNYCTYGLNQIKRVNDFYIGLTWYNGYVPSGISYDYLSTINNQSDVLTKTPDKTMKIIYTLREE